jgi:hypothetical protein
MKSRNSVLLQSVLGLAMASGVVLDLHAQSAPLLEDPPGIIGVAPTPVGGYTSTLSLALSRARSGTNRNVYGGGLEAEAGVTEGLDVRFGQSLEYGAAAPYPRDDETKLWGGGTLLAARWQLLEDEGWQPALGVFGAVHTSYGETSRPSQAGQVNLLISKTILEGDRPIALYGNLGWSELFNPMPEERHGRYHAAIGVAHTLDRDTSFGLSWVRSQQDRRERDENIVAAGISHRLSASGPILGLGAGAGIGQDSPSFLVFASMKWLFGAAAE